MSETRRLSTILFADIVGYTALMQEDEQHALSLLGSFQTILESKVPEFGGLIVQYFGDGCLLTFESTIKGVQCAIVMQKAFRKVKYLSSGAQRAIMEAEAACLSSGKSR